MGWYFHTQLILVTITLNACSQGLKPKVVSGSVDLVENFQSKHVMPRNIYIWLPEDYSDSTKYSVVYFHDGQMLFDSTETWNRQAWEIDDAASELMRKKQTKNFIVVGIWNSGENRHHEYFPQKPFNQLTEAEKDTVSSQLRRAGRIQGDFLPTSEQYLRFIVEELMPYVNKRYSVEGTKEHTFIAGSSMGGLISLYAVCEYPEVFGGAACLSTHWPGTFTLANNPVPNSLIRYLSQNLPTPHGHKFYFDCGSETLDSLYPKIQLQVDSLMAAKGFSNKSWLTRYFPGEDHSEKAWSRRIHLPLTFLLGE